MQWSRIWLLLALTGCDQRGLTTSPDLPATWRRDAGVDAFVPDAQWPVDWPSFCKHPPVVKSCTDGWCRVPAGCFLMGAPDPGPCHFPASAHAVTLTRSFEIMATEVTQGQFATVMGYNESQFINCGATCPVERVTWHEAAVYSNKLSVKAQLETCYTCSGGPPPGVPTAAPRRRGFRSRG